MGCMEIIRRKRRSRDRWKRSRQMNGRVSTESQKEPKHEEEHSFFILFKENSTIHGVRDLFVSPSKDLKIIWILFLIIACILTFHGCSQVLTEFMDRKVVVSYFVHGNDSLEIPDLLICPLNRFNRSYFEYRNMSSDLQHYVELSFAGIAFHSFQHNRLIEMIPDKIHTLESQLTKLLFSIDKTFDEFIQEATIPCEAFLGKDECKSADEVLTFAGKCFRVQGNRQILPGYGFGKKVRVTLPTHLYHPGFNNLPNDGIVIKLTASNKGIDNDISFIPSGSHTLVSISATQYSFLNEPPKFSCAEGDNRNYSRVWCFDSCLVEEAERSCNCSIISSMNKQHNNSCTPIELFGCFYKHVAYGDSPWELAKQKECKERCTTPCEYWSYSKTITSSPFPAPHYREMLSSQKEFDALKNVIYIDAFFNELEYTVIKHIRNLPLSSAIAQFGGQLSLWAGASVMSMAQLVIYVIYIVIHHIIRFGDRKRQALAAGRRLSLSLKRIKNKRSNGKSPAPSGRSDTVENSNRFVEEEAFEMEDHSDAARKLSNEISIAV